MSQPPPAHALTDELLNAFKSDIQPVQVPWSYRLGILVVTIVMILLPLIYIGLIGLVGWLVWYHMTHNASMLSEGKGRGQAMLFLVFVAPLVIGAIMIVFMFKPLFARPAKPEKKRALKREDEPTLFAFVDRLCDCVHAPKPKRIDVDGEINASASFRRGMTSFLFSSDLVLTLGLPLVAGLSLKQFAGVLAHEFGHFSQGAGMRLTYIIRTISYWFTRVVYERDAWDRWLADAAGSIDIRIGWILYVSQLMVWLTRKVLWILMMIGHAVSGLMLRQMEFDADRHEARLAGSATFESTARQLTVLGVAWQGAQRDLSDFYRDGRLADNMPRLMMHNVSQLSPDVLQKISQHTEQSKTKWLDTHPCDMDRIESAGRENTRGVFHCDRPATDLFRDFDGLAKNVSIGFYKSVFGDEFDLSKMHSTEELLSRQQRELEASMAMERYFQSAFSPLRPLSITVPKAETKALVSHVQQMREQIVQGSDAYRELAQQYDKEDDTVIEAGQVVALLSSGFKLQKDAFNVPCQSAKTATAAQQNAVSRMAAIGKEMLAYEKCVDQRMGASFALLNDRRVYERMKDAPSLVHELNSALIVHRKLVEHHDELITIRNEMIAFNTLLPQLGENSENMKLVENVLSRAKALKKKLRAIQSHFADLDYPFDHAEASMTVDKFLVPIVPAQSDNVGEMYEACQHLLNQITPLQVRVLARLASIGEQVESVCGMPVLSAKQSPEQSENNATAT